MTAPLREQLSNNAESVLDGTINNSVTSLDVTDGSVFPSTGNFRILIEDEIMIVTARSGDTLTVVRGQEGTAAASHNDGLSVLHTLTAGALLRIQKDNDVFHPTQPPLGVLSDGSGGILTSSDFTWDNQGGATVTDQNGTILLAVPAAGGENCRVLYRTAPAAPYTLIAGFQAYTRVNSGVPNWGLVFRKNSDQKLHACGMTQDSFGPIRFTMYNFSSPTSFSSTQYGRDDCLWIGEIFWVKIVDDNSNLHFSVSFDGIEWVLLKTVTRTSFMSGGPDRIGFYGNNAASSGSSFWLRLVHWSTF